MKKSLSVMACIVFLLLATTGRANELKFCDEIPPEIMQMELSDNPEAVFSDCIIIEGTPLGDYCFVLSPWNMHGYLLKDGSWELTAQVSPMSQENNGFLFFRRHVKGAVSQNEPANTFENDLGFDIVRSDSREMAAADIIQYHWLEGDFRVVGWNSKESDEYAVYESGQWIFRDRSAGAALGSVRLDKIQEYGLLQDFASLPITLEEAQAMEGITQSAAEALFPGWTLSFYESYNAGHAASAGYFRIEDGLLTIRRVSLSSENKVAFQADTMPVPLSAELLTLLQTQEAGKFIDASGYGDTFLTEESFSRELIPVSGKVVENDMQTGGLLLLTEDESGSRHIEWVEKEGNGYSIRTSNPLPQDAHFDLFHCGDDDLILEWDGQSKCCGFSRTADGGWRLNWVMSDAEENGVFSMLFCGIARDSMNTTDNIIIGSHPWQDLFFIDFLHLPESSKEAIASLSRDGWAVVCNPVETDRLHLRSEPDRASVSLGKFYNRTPVEVLKQKGDWSRVRIGLDGHLEGWMLTKYLTFGPDMDTVRSAMPTKFLWDDYVEHPLYSSASLNETTNVTLSSASYFWIIGVVEDELYIFLDSTGNTGYLPQAWFWDGNG